MVGKNVRGGQREREGRERGRAEREGGKREIDRAE